MSNIIDENLIIIGADVSTAEECIQLGGEMLLKNGRVKEEYVNAVLKREIIFPTGLQGESMGLAIPHTDSTFVEKPSVAVIIPNKPVKFRAMGGREDEYVDCSIILPLAVKDSKNQLTMLKKIVKILGNSELLERIIHATTKEEIMEYLDILNRTEEEK